MDEIIEEKEDDTLNEEIVEELGFVPSINITVEDSEYQQYLKLHEKYGPPEPTKKPRTLLKILLSVFLSIFAIFTVLFSIGFIMGLNGTRPQQLDWEVVTNQLSGNSSQSETIDELEKVDKN